MKAIPLLATIGLLVLTHCVAAETGGPSPLPPAPPRPEAAAGPTEVGYALWMGDVTGIDSVAQTFSASFLLVTRWRDPQLAHPGPGAKQYALDDVWHPRLLIANQAGELQSTLPDTVDVAPDGSVIYRQRLIGAFSQSLNLRDFPFDRDRFRIQVVALGHRPGEIRFQPDPVALATGMREGIAMPETLTIQDWEIRSVETRPLPFRVTHNLELAGFAAEFMAKRQSHHFVVKVIIPLVLIVMMSWAVFWIEPQDASTQMGVSVTAMLTLIAYRFAVDGDVPKLPYLTRLDSFILMSSVLVFLSLIEVMVTSKFANRERLELARAIDRRCRWIFPPVFAAATLLIFCL